MKKQIDDKILSIPPYLSTKWENIAAIFLKGSKLVVDLTDGNKVQIPDLSNRDIEQIFHFHAQFLEREEEALESDTESSAGQSFSLPWSMNLEGVEGIGSAMQHNPEQSGFPALPKHLLERIGELAKMINPDEGAGLNPPVEGCNCIYCQISRALHKGEESPPPTEEPKVSEEDLHFEQWRVRQLEDKLYEVTNKLDPTETYRVFLGNPVGCTCGKPNCEHIVAVLKS
jgi:hypothetical protein